MERSWFKLVPVFISEVETRDLSLFQTNVEDHDLILQGTGYSTISVHTDSFTSHFRDQAHNNFLKKHFTEQGRDNTNTSDINVLAIFFLSLSFVFP